MSLTTNIRKYATYFTKCILSNTINLDGLNTCLLRVQIQGVSRMPGSISRASSLPKNKTFVKTYVQKWDDLNFLHFSFHNQYLNYITIHLQLM
jgi:hypothetical protein